jgi:hypothetical protein
VRTSAIVLALLLPLIGALLLVDWRFPPTEWWRAIENFGHVPMFAVLTGVLFALGRAIRPLTPRRNYIYAGAAALFLGAATEVAQLYVGRDASWGDLSSDVLGIGIALAICALVDGRMRFLAVMRFGLLVVAVGMTSYAALPVIEMLRAYAHRNAQFPVLAQFEDERELFWTRSVGSRRTIKNGSMHVELRGEPYPGVSWFEPVPDWRGYRWLVLEISNPNDSALEITVRVHDSAHSWEFADRFNQPFVFAPQERRTLRIDLEDVRHAPLGRAMDMEMISDVSIFRSGPKGPAAIVIHALRLEKAQ